jgi:hypothetical protein
MVVKAIVLCLGYRPRLARFGFVTNAKKETMMCLMEMCSTKNTKGGINETVGRPKMD